MGNLPRDYLAAVHYRGSLPEARFTLEPSRRRGQRIGPRIGVAGRVIDRAEPRERGRSETP
jgi:hypothetical protein